MIEDITREEEIELERQQRRNPARSEFWGEITLEKAAIVLERLADEFDKYSDSLMTDRQGHEDYGYHRKDARDMVAYIRGETCSCKLKDARRNTLRASGEF